MEDPDVAHSMVFYKRMALFFGSLERMRPFETLTHGRI
jgi:hypothetical protein